ncbi:glycosyltransferase [Adhaeribacter soli]|uniref:Glycosyltransferase family 4 protein n=1 Tax=Adhaeribacter soli TaxID=2607655 RepID=A0A5N1IY38_9BACT|nr:glycosyltransferase [Adhaeribacter soli]KAA9339028.1 glycosyltransferase family 4 protein [Adhaeribacter soli]
MKIVHVVEPFAAGVALFVKSLTETMPEDLHIIIHGEREHVMSAKEVKRTFPKGNVRFLRWKSAQRSINPFKDLLALSELHKVLRRLKRKNLVDAVHLHSSKSGFLGRMACRLAGIKNVIYTPNGAPFLSGKNFLFNFLYKQIEKFGNGIGGKVVCCSASELQEYQKLGIQASFINNGISLKALASVKKPKTKNDKFCIITSGRIEEQKNPALFNEIAAYFSGLNQFEFIWAGDGHQRDKLTAENISVTGWLNSQEVSDLVAQADIYISTSMYEGLSFGVLEALSLRKPVLLSNCVGNADVVKNGMNGDIFSSEADAIVKLLTYYNNREMIDVMGQHGQDICSTEFDMHRNFKSYQQLYRNIPAGEIDAPRKSVK